MSTQRKEEIWTLRNRLLALVRCQIDEKSQYKTLENLTGIKATHWRDFAAGKQRPTAEMIEAAARLWPQHAFWLVTGISDAEHGHTAPERGNFPHNFAKQEAPELFFKKSLELTEACINAFNDDPDFSDPELQLALLLLGTHRNAHALFPAHEARIIALRDQLDELSDARKLEYDIKEVQPHETHEEGELRLPTRTLKLKKITTLSKSSIEDLEALLEAERHRLEISKRVDERLKMMKK